MALVLYHGNCYDGFGAAWAASKFLSDDTDFIPVVYGKPIPQLPEGQDIFLLDFSYPRKVLDKLLKQSRSVQIIDHHKTAQEALAGFPLAIFDLDHSGAVLTWNYFQPEQALPTLLAYVEDRDLARYQLPDSELIHDWLQSYPRTFPVWDNLAKMLTTNEGYEEAVTQGTAINRMKRQKIVEICDHARCITLGGYHDIPVVNTTCFMSEAAVELLSIYPDAPFSGFYFGREDNRIQWGLRSRKGFDCSAVAKQFGGGGHPQAAGFEQ